MLIDRVVVDASPLICLSKRDLVELFPALFKDVAVSEAVIKEVMAKGTVDFAAKTLISNSWIRNIGAVEIDPRVASWDLGEGDNTGLSFALRNSEYFAVCSMIFFRLEERRDGAPMKLAENEERALRELREELFAKYPIIDIRLYGSKARGEGRQDSDLDVMIEIPHYDRAMVGEIDDIIYRINLEHDVFISALVFGKDELEEGPMSEAPIYKVIQREGVSL